MEKEKSLFFRFIPKKYHNDVELEGSEITLPSHLVKAINTDNASWQICDKNKPEEILKKELQPVAFTEGDFDDEDDSIATTIIWFYDHKTKRWYGWGRWRHASSCCLYIEGYTLDAPDFILEHPKDFVEIPKRDHIPKWHEEAINN